MNKGPYIPSSPCIRASLIARIHTSSSGTARLAMWTNGIWVATFTEAMCCNKASPDSRYWCLFPAGACVVGGELAPSRVLPCTGQSGTNSVHREPLCWVIPSSCAGSSELHLLLFAFRQPYQRIRWDGCHSGSCSRLRWVAIRAMAPTELSVSWSLLPLSAYRFLEANRSS